ncbi:rhodanese-like domain-containing protein [Oceanobacillus sp. CAU 1775]
MNEITAKDLEEKLTTEKVHIIDVREDDEVAKGIIPEADHIPLGEISTRLEELDKNEHYYIVCRSGGRSGKACDYLSELGYDTTNVTGGMLAWEGEVEVRD